MRTLFNRLPKSPRRQGMTLVEVAVALPIVAIALGMFVQMLTAGTKLRQSTRDEWIAGMAAQETLEVMRNNPFHQLVVLYNADPMDDPGGPGTAPGQHFGSETLTALTGDPDGMPGRIILPTFNNGDAVAPDWQLREDQANEDLGMPRDLNGDSLISSADLTDDYSILPVLVEIQWQGRFGPRLFRFHTILTETHLTP